MKHVKTTIIIREFPPPGERLEDVTEAEMREHERVVMRVMRDNIGAQEYTLDVTTEIEEEF